MRAKDLSIDWKRIARGGPPVLLLGNLNVLRALGVASIPTIVASADPTSPAFDSRYACGRCVIPSLDEHPTEAVESLLEMGELIAGSVGGKIPLFYTSDDPLKLIYRAVSKFSRYYRFLVNDPALGQSLLRKDQFGILAQRYGLRVPRMLQWQGEGDGALANAPGPVIVKPKKKTGWHDSALYETLFDRKGKAKVFPTGEAAHADPDLRRFKDDVVIQEYIPGSDDRIVSFHGFADERGNVLASFSGRKIRTFPKHTGESTFLELVKDNDLAREGKEIIARLGFRGPFKIDFKKHPATGKPYVMEINARFTLWNYLGAANGVNVSRVAYEYLTGRAVTVRDDYATTYRWLRFRLDYRAYRELRHLGEMTLGAWLRSILSTKKVYYLFSWRDPKPLVRRCLRLLFRMVAPWRAMRSSQISTATKKHS